MNTRPRLRRLALAATLFGLFGTLATAADPWVFYKGGEGPGKGKHIVLISGDEEYRSEEALPQLGKILATHHGFDCTVLFAIGKDGSINPNQSDNIPGLEALKKADLMIIFTRFRHLPADQMDHIAEYIEAGKPVIGMRTATHAFNIKGNHPYAGYSWDNKGKEWHDGFGRQILGETWISHHGNHGKESTRGIIASGAEQSAILKGIKNGDIWGPTDVYGVRLPLPEGSVPLVMGQVLEGMKSDDKPVEGKKNEPMMPVAWIRRYTPKSGKQGKAFCTTMGASQDLQSEGVRRLLVNASYWAVGLENKIDPTSSVAIVGDYKPHPFGFGTYVKGVKPEDHASK